jgi:hypothetical protein
MTRAHRLHYGWRYGGRPFHRFARCSCDAFLDTEAAILEHERLADA